MAMASSHGDENAAGPNAEMKEDRKEALSKLHMQLAALFTVKAAFNKDIKDFCIWRIIKGKDITEPFFDQIVLAYKRRGNRRTSGKWSFLLLPWSKGKLIPKNHGGHRKKRLQLKIAVKCFLTFRRLRNDRKMLAKFGKIEHLTCYQDVPEGILEVASDGKDFLFAKTPGKFRDGRIYRDALVGKVEEIDSWKAREPSTGRSGYSLESEIRDFCGNVGVSSVGSDLESLKSSTKDWINKHAGTPDVDFAHDMLIKLIQDRLDRVDRRHNVVSGSELRGLFELLKVGGQGGSKLRYNLSGPVSDFVGRGAQLGEMLSLLGRKSGHWEIGPVKKVVLSGIGGAGKTELAREYCRRHFISLYDKIAWINADNEERIAASFKALAFGELGIEERTHSGEAKNAVAVAREAIDLLKARRTLLVYDNAESLLRVEKYLPNESVEGRVHVILTSRSRDWDDIPTIHLKNFKPEESLELVKCSVGHLTCWNKEDAVKLCQDLGNFPLALKQATSYIRQQDALSKHDGRIYSICHYLRALELDPEPLLDHPLISENDYADTTFQVVLSTLLRLKSSLDGQMSTTLLNILSYLNPSWIRVDGLLRANSKYSKLSVQRSIATLRELSIVFYHVGMIKVDPMVRVLNRVRLRKLGREAVSLAEAFLFARSTGVVDSMAAWERAMVHKTLVRAHPRAAGETSARAFVLQSSYLACRFSARCYEVTADLFGSHHRRTLEVGYVLSLCQESCGLLEEAAQMADRCLERFRRSYLPRSKFYFSTLYRYGCLLHQLDKRLGSVLAFQEILRESPRLMGSGSNLALMTKAELLLMSDDGEVGICLRSDLNELEVAFRRVVSSWEDESRLASMLSEISAASPSTAREGEDENPTVLETIVDCEGDYLYFRCRMRVTFSNILRENGKLTEAYRELHRAQSLMKTCYKEGHAVLILSKISMAELKHKMGNAHSAVNDLRAIRAADGAFLYNNVIRAKVWCLQTQIECELGQYLNAMISAQLVCSTVLCYPFQDDGLDCVINAMVWLFCKGDYSVLSIFLMNLFPTLLEEPGQKFMPRFFVDFCHRTVNRLLDKCRPVDTARALKGIHEYCRVAMGDDCISTLQVKLSLARLYLEGRGRIEKGHVERDLGRRYLLELKASLAGSECDKEGKDLLENVEILMRTGVNRGWSGRLHIPCKSVRNSMN